MRNEPNRILRIVVPLAIFGVVGGGIAAALLFGGGKQTPVVAPTEQTPTTEGTLTGNSGASQAPGQTGQGTQAALTDTAAGTTAGGPAKVADAGATEPGQTEPGLTEPGQGEPDKSVGIASQTPPAGETTSETVAGKGTGREAGALTGLHAVKHPVRPFTPIGSITSKDKGGQYEMQLEFSPIGAGIHKLSLANHYEHADRRNNEVLQRFQPSAANTKVGIVPYASEALIINDQRVVLSVDPSDIGNTFWREIKPGEFEATIEDAAGTPVASVIRRFELASGSFEFVVRQQVRNLTGGELRLSYEQFGPADPPMGVIRYGGDTRRLRFGYLLPAASDPAQPTRADEFLITHPELISDPAGYNTQLATPLPYWTAREVWPNTKSREQGLEASWAAMTNRYFAVSVQPPVTPGNASAEERTLDVQRIERFVVPNGNPMPGSMIERLVNFIIGTQTLPAGDVALKFTSPPRSVPAGEAVDFSIAAYAGPMENNTIKAQPVSEAVGLRGVVVYSFGGPCAVCTFQWLTHLLLAFLTTIQTFVTHDWALAIMLLVVCVRTILHPVTRWSQVNLLRFGKQMQSVAPKQRAIQEKYGKDPQKMREEVAKLMREENINYAGALGCLPMFLQTPVWIALSAMLFYAFELRHEPAFFGIVQSLTGGSWQFLGDLAEPDKLIDFGMAKGIPLPLLSGFIGPVNSLNILPLLMGVLFYFQQKYMQPPTTATLTPEQQQQQKIMRVMMVVMFPLFMYNAPSGLALYFLTNSTLGIIESRWIRSHVDKSELEPKKPTTGKKKTGWLARMQERAMELQKQREQQMRLAEKYKKK